MSRIQVDSTEVAAASTAVHASAAAIGGEVDRMMHHLLALQQSWTGTASSSFQQVVSDWRATQERVRASLEEIQRALALASARYAEVEQATTRLFSGG